MTVDGPELHKLNRWLYDAHETLAVQIHTHPDDAYHSETDDEFPIVTALGGASVVVPRFARDGLTGPDTAVFRLMHDGWVRTTAKATEVLIIT